MNNHSLGSRPMNASGCCLLGIIVAFFAAAWYVLKYLFIGFYWMLKYVFIGLYYAIAAPFLLFENLWRRGGIWRPLLLVIASLMFLVGLVLFIAAPTTPQQPNLIATVTAVLQPSQTALVQSTPSILASATASASPTIPIPPTVTEPLVQPSTATAVVPTTAPEAPSVTAIATAPIAAPAEPADDKIPARISNVVDGDTVKLDFEGKVQSIRMIGIDTPEVKDPRKPVQCYGAEASAFTKKTLLGKDVLISFDPTQDKRDRYDRLLLYIWLPDGTLFNQLIIQEGYAFEYTYRIPYQYQDAFKAAENDARNAARGLWSPTSCNGVASPVTPTP